MARKDQMGLVLMIDTGITDGQVTQLNSDIQTFMTEMYRNNIDKRIVMTGDSHSCYWNNKVVRRMDWQLQTMGYEYFPVGVSGQTLATINTNYASAGKEASYYKASRTNNVIVLWAGTNDISAGTDLATLQSNVTTFCTNAHATGYSVVLMPTMARNFGGDATKTLLIDSYNQWLISNWNTIADAYTGFPDGEHFYKPRADFASDAAYIAHNQTLVSDASYYIDGTHLTETLGYKPWGDVVANAVLSIT